MYSQMTYYSSELRLDEKSGTVGQCAAPARSSRYRNFGKRTLDLALVLLTVPMTVPVVAILVLVILLTGQSPFYVQKRLGLHGKIFNIWKLRTMMPNAEARLETYLSNNPDARVEWDKKQKLANDPRVTAFGVFLRKSSLDELPQLFNVFNGTMSLIGPRPMIPEQRGDYEGNAYYKMRPGMSGLWQISDRSDGDFCGRVRYDEIYYRELSFGTDIHILVQTVGVVMRGTGV